MTHDSLIQFRVDVIDQGEWMRWTGLTQDLAVQLAALQELREEYPHKQFRIVKVTTTEEPWDAYPARS